MLPTDNIDGPNRFAKAALAGCIVGDGLGQPFEFIDVALNPDGLDNVGAQTLVNSREVKELRNNRPKKQDFNLPIGTWTDDGSQMFALAASLGQKDRPTLDHGAFKEHLRLWWHENGWFYCLAERIPVGLGGTIKKSLDQWNAFRKALPLERGGTIKNIVSQWITFWNTLPPSTDVSKLDAQQIFSATPDPFQNCDGNGSIMRLAPVAIFAKDVQEAMKFSWEQSYLTTPGVRSADCARFMAYLIHRACYDSSCREGIINHKVLLEKLIADFLRESKETPPPQRPIAVHSEEVHNIDSGTGLHKDLISLLTNPPNYWNWREDTLTELNPATSGNLGYYGSFVMDGLAIALHCVYSTDSFEKAIIKAVLMCGDADTTAAITGQIAGALYGMDQIPACWQESVLCNKFRCGNWRNAHIPVEEISAEEFMDEFLARAARYRGPSAADAPAPVNTAQTPLLDASVTDEKCVCCCTVS